MLRNVLLFILGALIIVPIGAGLFGVKRSQFSAMADASAKMQMPPTVVNAIPVRQYQLQPKVSAVGSIKAMQGTTVRTEVEGIIRSISFTPGTEVQAGSVLLQLDDSVEQAQLREAEAASRLAKISYDRALELSKRRFIAQSDLDSARASVDRARAQVDYERAVIAKKTVRAPFSGRLGIRQISVGQYLNKGSEVVSLQALDPIYAEFSLPQQYLGELHEGLQLSLDSDAFPDQKFDGKITAFNPEIDPLTRSIRVQATLPNPDGQLRPGMYVSVQMQLSRSEQVLLIPETAVQHGPYGDTVFIIDPPKDSDQKSPLTLRQQPVELGTRIGDFVVASKGVKAGEQLVSTGVFKLFPGMKVVIDNSLAPDFQLAPHPDNS